MKVLLLGNSSEFYGEIAESDRRASKAARALEEAFGEPVEMIVRRIWPTPVLPEKLEGWLAEMEPDIVFLNVIAYWFNYQSVPLKFERVLGRLGRPVRAAGIKAAQTPWIGHTRVFHWTRRRLQKAIGGETFFTPEQVIDVVSACIRVVVRREHCALVVKGPRSSGDYALQRGWAEERRLKVHRALASLCEDLHVDYVGAEVPRYLTEPDIERLGDRLHRGTAGHARSADEIAGILEAAWNRQRALTGH